MQVSYRPHTFLSLNQYCQSNECLPIKHTITNNNQTNSGSVASSKTKSIWKMLGPFVTASRLTPTHQVSLPVLSRATCASMSTTTTTTTTRDKGDRYGPMEWAQLGHHRYLVKTIYTGSNTTTTFEQWLLYYLQSAKCKVHALDQKFTCILSSLHKQLTKMQHTSILRVISALKSCTL